MANVSLLDTVIKELCEREFYIKAGELYEKAKVYDRALKLYRWVLLWWPFEKQPFHEFC